MQIYHYAISSGEFLKEEAAKLDPLESELQGSDVFLIPANATQIVPPNIGPKEVAIFTNGNWVIKPDFRGETWFSGYNEPVVINQIGDPAELGLDKVEPVADLNELKVDAIDALNAEFSKRVIELTGNKPNEERQMWMLINLNAQKFLSGDETKRDFLEGQIPPNKKAELIAAGEDLAAWKANDALTVKAPITEKVVELAMGMKKAAEEAIEAATTHEELNTTLTALKAQEAQTIASFQAKLNT